jgi:hypothetical protein
MMMISIVCSNPECPAPNRKFLWDECPHLGAKGKLVKPGEPGAVSFVVECPYGHPNKIWVKDLQTIEIDRIL